MGILGRFSRNANQAAPAVRLHGTIRREKVNCRSKKRFGPPGSPGREID